MNFKDMCSFNISQLDPLDSEQGYNPDAQSAYLNRVSSIVPGMPGEVLLEWFQQNPGKAATWAFLDLPALTWSPRLCTPATLPGAEIMRGGASQFQRLTKEAPIFRRLVHMQVTRDLAWKNAPILLETANLTFLSPPPEWLQTPLHLVEGYHRFVTLWSIRDQLDPGSPHRFWVGS
ncbi:hypothetical protein [Caulobacter sp.]|uniref:hypothetical protein n=1 Tax=Caulobacter sp. TaxID=78 RepID=UPI002B4A43C4|nr:hypothetical protein [Caulobacter sp.]HJV42856.1 hypothetical protein [Caulobacter sp.]